MVRQKEDRLDGEKSVKVHVGGLGVLQQIVGE